MQMLSIDFTNKLGGKSMKTRELILWVLVIITLTLCITNYIILGWNFNLLKAMTEIQNYILELIDIRSGWMLL